MSVETSIALRLEYQRYNKSIRELARQYGYPTTTVFRHAKTPIPTAANPRPFDRRHHNKGRPRLLDARADRRVVQAVKSLRESEGPSFSADQVREEADLRDVATRRTVSYALHRNGYKKRQLRKKGLLTAKDRRLRVKYAREVQRDRPADYWKNGICMFLDGVSFVHKTNPFYSGRNHLRVGYRKRNEGLKVTTKGAKEGVGGKTLTFYVGISWGHGVVFCRPFEGTFSGATFAAWAERELPAAFEWIDKGKRFVQDGCPVMNSKVVKSAYTRMGAEVCSIPARSPDLNPVENVFNNIRRELRNDAKTKRIVHETYQEFGTRVRNTLINYRYDTIDKTIETMAKRLQDIVVSGGYRTKY